MVDYLKSKNGVIGEQITAEECFEALSPDQKKVVENNTSILEFKKGEIIIKQGFIASHILFIETGIAKLDVTNDQKTSTVKLLGPGTFVGIICSFACKSMDFSSVALEETTVRMISMDIFEQLIKENGEFALKLVKHMSALTNNMVHWITRIRDKNVEGSLALILLEFASIYGQKTFKLPVTRVMLGKLAGISKESTINTLSQFNHDGLIKIEDKSIEILDQEKMELLIKNA